MKNIMKKILSILLVALVCMTSAPVVNTLTFKASAATITSYEQGDIIEFGWYPQSKVTDSSVTSALMLAKSEWVSYNYYSGTGSYSDGKMTASDYMRYTDVVYDGNKYRGVVFDSYRPEYTGFTSSTSDTYQDDNNYFLGITYWFKYEPVKWRVLDPDTGMVMSEMILDAQPYNNYLLHAKDENEEYCYFGSSEKTYYANNYAESSIRQWLNNDFYNTAFSSSQQDIIKVTTLDNSAYSDSYSDYNSATTNDKIYLLSWNDTINTNYGFSSSSGYDANDANRTACSSDYAKSQGLYFFTGVGATGTSNWFLRSPGHASHCSSRVSSGGGVVSYCRTDSTFEGVRPALNLNPTSEIFQPDVTGHIHKYEKIVTAPTCTEKGYTTYTCACGDSYVADYADALGHTYESEITTPATHLTEGVETFTCSCGDSYTKSIAKTTEHTYEAVVTAPTCTEKGYTTYTCACGDSYVADYADALGHTYESEITTPATHLTEGVETFTCSCGDTYTKSIAKTPEHAYINTYVVEPTCNEKGYTAHVCECGDIIKDNFTEKTEHSYNGRVCENCGAECSCMCHYSGIMKIIWKILNFFYKLFRVNHICACGVAHY